MLMNSHHVMRSRFDESLQGLILMSTGVGLEQVWFNGLGYTVVKCDHGHSYDGHPSINVMTDCDINPAPSVVTTRTPHT